MAKVAYYKGRKELCLIVSGKRKRSGKPFCHYPVSKGGPGSINCGRVRNAKARAAQNNDTAAIMRGGWSKFARRCGVESK